MIDELARRRAQREQRKQADDVVSAGGRSRPHPATTTRWQVDKNDDGSIRGVYVNKPTGAAAGLWHFEHSVTDEGEAVLQVEQCQWDESGISATAERAWTIPEAARDEPWEGNQRISHMLAALVGLVGWRTAQAAERRLWPSA